MESIVTQLEDSLSQSPIGETENFTWLATPIGIAAICRVGEPSKSPPFEDAVREGIEVSIDLSREEREFHQTTKGLVLLFYS